MSKTIKFYEDELKTKQVYPEIDPEGKYPGVTVGLAENLTSTDGITDGSSFQYRSAASHTSIATDGYAVLKKLHGARSTTTTIPESIKYNLLTVGVKTITLNLTTFKTQENETGVYNFIYTPTITYTSNLISSINKATFAKKMNAATGTFIFEFDAAVDYNDPSTIVSSFNKNTFADKVLGVAGTYEFTYATDSWYIGSEQVSLSQYGFTLNSTALTDGMKITVYYTANNWKYGQDVVALYQYGIITTGREKPGNTITINYTANNWMLDNNTVTLSNYGISITNGAAAINDNIQVIYQAEEVGVIQIANPTHLLSIGMNQFNKRGSQILSNSGIDGNGAVGTVNDHYVIWFKCLGGQTYTIYDKNEGSIVQAAYSAEPIASYSTGLTILTPVTTSSEGNAVTTTTTKTYYQTVNDGYMAIETTDIKDLCCHLTWSGTEDEIYAKYWEFKLVIPYEDKNGNKISTYGLPQLDDNVFDEIDLENNKYYVRVGRIENTTTNLSNISAQTSNYIYDNNWIYYELSNERVYDLREREDIYPCADFGTEEFLGSTLELSPTIVYQNNLKDKLRRDVEVLANKVNDISGISGDNAETKYTSVKAVNKVANNIYTMLGLAVNTYNSGLVYSAGDYVVYNNELYKCVTSASNVGSLNSLTPTGVSYDTSSTIISSINTTTFLAADFIQEHGLGEYTFEYYSYTTPGGSTYYDSRITAPDGAKIEWDAATELGITTSGPTGKENIIVTNGYWTKSYLFKA